MTKKTNARIAGYAFILYIATGILSMVVSARARGGGTGIAGRLAGMAEHPTEIRIAYLLALFAAFMAPTLGVTLYALTRDEDRDLAMLGMVCRVGEGIVGVSVPTTLIMLWLATTTGPTSIDAAGAHAIGAYLQKLGGMKALVSAMLFAVGSTLFCWLLLRGRMIPVPLARLGVVASLILVIGVPIQLAGFASGVVFQVMWLPMAVFELVVAPWLIIKGVATAPSTAGIPPGGR